MRWVVAVVDGEVGSGGEEELGQVAGDAFAVLGVERRPWIDPEVLRRAYQERARTWHPDRDGGEAEKFRTLGEAYELVRDVASRLRALAGDGESAGTEVTDADLFMRVGSGLQASRAVLAKREAARGVLERALLAGEVKGGLDELEALRAAVAERIAAAELELRATDGRWPEVRAVELSGLARRFDRLTSWRREVGAAELALRG